MLNIVRCGIALVVIGLFGCGGGGGGGDGGAAPTGGGGGGGITQPSSAPVAITSTNSQKAAEVAVEPALSGVNVLATATGVETTTASPARLTQVLRSAVRPLRAPLTVVGVVQTLACSLSGSISIDAADNGSSATLTFNACSDLAGQSINGSITASGISAAPDGSSFSATYTMNITFIQSGFATLRMVGNFSLSESCTPGTFNCTTTFSGSSLGTQEGAEIWFIANFSITEAVTTASTTVTANYTVLSSVLGGALTVTTPTPLVTLAGALHPHTGVILITGANNSRVRVTVNSSGTASNAVTVALDTDNDGFDDGTTNYSWATLEAT
jgi:hypothetical protein